MKNGKTLKIFAILLLFAEFLSPGLVPDSIDLGATGQKPISFQAQKKANLSVSYWTEESRNTEEERDQQKAQDLVSDFAIFRSSNIDVVVPVEAALQSFLSGNDQFDVRPPLYELHKSLLI
jgi:hypothetical protein